MGKIYTKAHPHTTYPSKNSLFFHSHKKGCSTIKGVQIFLPYMKSLWIFSTLNLIFLKKLNKDIKYMSRPDNLLLINISLPPLDIYTLSFSLWQPFAKPLFHPNPNDHWSKRCTQMDTHASSSFSTIPIRISSLFSKLTFSPEIAYNHMSKQPRWTIW